ncbi:MAG TPA: sulfotransferase [Verrucomicrobiae bacterium]|nr:sulfotransferase [Verrucomicrobiae bacterium]
MASSSRHCVEKCVRRKCFSVFSVKKNVKTAFHQPSSALLFSGMNGTMPVAGETIPELLRKAKAAWNVHNFQLGLEAMTQAHQLDPANVPILLDLGLMHGLRYDYAGASRYFDEAARVAPFKAEAFAAAGMRCHQFPNLQMAALYFERAITEPGVPGEILIELADAYERQHKLTEAAVFLERALKAKPDYPSALLVQARLHRRDGKLEEAEKLLLSFLGKPDCKPATYIEGWYELGGVYDRQKRYDDAMTAFLNAKSLQLPYAKGATEQLQRMQQRAATLQKELTRDDFRRWREYGKSLSTPRRFALLCGFPRSGTTLLEQIMDSHPQIISAEETRILQEEACRPLRRTSPPGTPPKIMLDSVSLPKLQQFRDDYFRSVDLFLGQPVGDRLLIDKNPSFNNLITDIIRVIPEAKFIAALRDPRDVCMSCFMQSLPLNAISSSFLTLDGTATQYASSMGLWRFVAAEMSNPNIEVRYEDVVENLEAQARRVLEFLEVPWVDDVLRFNEHAQKKTVMSPTYADVAKPVFKTAVGRWRNYEKYFEPHLEKLNPFLKAFGYE